MPKGLSPETLVGLLPYCRNDEQKAKIEALIEHGNQREAAIALGLNQSSISRTINLVRNYARDRGVDEQCVTPGPDGYSVDRLTDLVKVDPETGEGKLLLRWRRSRRDHATLLEQLEAVGESLADRVSGKADPIDAPAQCDEHVLNMFPIGDHHLGLYVWAKETGTENYDVDAAESQLIHAVRYLVRQAPPAKVALVAPLGDFFHYETKDARSLNSGHSYDADGRYSRMIDAGVSSMCAAIDEALTRHAEVWVTVTLGNHDWHPSLALEKILSAYYHREPRVKILEGHGGLYHYVEWGRCLLGFHHGHMKQLKALSGVMPRYQPEAWGRTVYRYWHTGHVHRDHLVALDDGSIGASYGVLPPQDAYNAGAAHVHEPRAMQRRTYHREWGDITSSVPIRLVNHLRCKR